MATFFRSISVTIIYEPCQENKSKIKPNKEIREYFRMLLHNDLVSFPKVKFLFSFKISISLE